MDEIANSTKRWIFNGICIVQDLFCSAVPWAHCFSLWTCVWWPVFEDISCLSEPVFPFLPEGQISAARCAAHFSGVWLGISKILVELGLRENESILDSLSGDSGRLQGSTGGIPNCRVKFVKFVGNPAPENPVEAMDAREFKIKAIKL